MLKIERWKTIEEFPNYQVSDYGRVRRVTNGRGHTKAGRILKPFPKKEYLYVRLYPSNGQRHFLVSRLVAKAFIPNPLNSPEVNHKENPKSNNRASNLEWNTRIENQSHAVKTGQWTSSHLKGSHNSRAKLTEALIPTIRQLHAGGESMRSLAKQFHVTHRTISQAINGKTYRDTAAAEVILARMEPSNANIAATMGV